MFCIGILIAIWPLILVLQRKLDYELDFQFHFVLECKGCKCNFDTHRSRQTTPFESAHQFTLVCTVSDSKTIPGCHYNLCSNHSSDWLTPTFVCSERFSHSLDTLCSCCTLKCAYCDRGQRCFSLFGIWSPSLTAALKFDSGCFFSSAIIQNSAWRMLNKSASLSTQDHVLHHMVALDLMVKTQVDRVVKTQACAVWLFSTLLLSSKGKFHADSSARLDDRSNSPDRSLSMLIWLTGFSAVGSFPLTSLFTR